ALTRPGALDNSALLTVSDLLRSAQFQIDLQASGSFRESYAAYEAARRSAATLGMGSADLDLAHRVLDALFVDYLAYHRSPRMLTTREIAESVLATTSTAIIPPADQVLTILGRLRQLRQVKFQPGEGARFEPEAGTGPLPAEVLNRKKQELSDEDPTLLEDWATLLQASAPSVGLWSALKLDTGRPTKAPHGRVQYAGSVELKSAPGTGRGSADLSYASGRHFHVVVLTGCTAVDPDDLEDPRVAIVVPGALQPDEIDLGKTYRAAVNVLEDRTLMAAADGAALRMYAEQQKRESAQKIIAGQSRVYRRGQIVSRTGVACNPDSTFQTTDGEEAIRTIADRLLGAAYDRFDDVLRTYQFKGNSRLDPAADAGKVFAGLIGGSSQGADVGAGQNFGPALGMSKQMFPNQLDLDGDHPAIALILQRIAGAARTGLATEGIYETLCGVPYGVPHEIVTLWLLACVRGGKAGAERRRIEIQLQKNARARLKGERRPPNGKISFSNVKDLEWASSLRSDFLAVQPSDDVPFGAVVEYGKVFDSMLKAPSEPDQEIEEERRLRQTLMTAREQAENTRTALTNLAAAMAQPLPNDARETLKSVVEVL
ncbi:MAG: hypothetical protein ACRDIY_06480, partial [Chloroflexota bacterium]